MRGWGTLPIVYCAARDDGLEDTDLWLAKDATNSLQHVLMMARAAAADVGQRPSIVGANTIVIGLTKVAATLVPDADALGWHNCRGFG